MNGWCVHVGFLPHRVVFKTDDPHEHLEKLEKVLDSLRQHDLLEKGSKCSLFRTEVEVLGFLVSADGTRPTSSKVETVVRMAPPETVSQLRSFLGMKGYDPFWQIGRSWRFCVVWSPR